MKYREYLMGGPIDPPKGKSQLTDEQQRQLAMSYARYNQAPPRPIGPEAGLRPVEPVFGAMTTGIGLRGLYEAIKPSTARMPGQREWDMIPESPQKRQAQEIGEFIWGSKFPSGRKPFDRWDF